MSGKGVGKEPIIVCRYGNRNRGKGHKLRNPRKVQSRRNPRKKREH